MTETVTQNRYGIMISINVNVKIKKKKKHRVCKEDGILAHVLASVISIVRFICYMQRD